MSPKKNLQNYKQFIILSQIYKFSPANRAKPTLCKIYTFPKSYIDILNKKIDYQALVQSPNLKKIYNKFKIINLYQFWTEKA